MFSANVKVPKNVNCIRKIGEGANQEVFLCSNNNKKKICVCLPKKETEEQKWLRFSRRGMTIGYYMPKTKKVHLASGELIYRNGEWQLHENYVSGRPFNEKMFNKLSADQQAHAIFDFATFMLDLNTLDVNVDKEIFGKIEAPISIKDTLKLKYKKCVHRFACYKKAFLSGISNKHYIKAKDLKRIKCLFKVYNFSRQEIECYDSLLKSIENNVNVCKMKGPYYSDFHQGNILYDDKTHSWGIIDLAGTHYHGLVYHGMARLFPIFGEDMLEKLCWCYNELAHKKGKEVMMDFHTLKKCAIVSFARKVVDGEKEAQKVGSMLKNYPQSFFNVGVRLKPHTERILQKLVKDFAVT